MNLGDPLRIVHGDLEIRHQLGDADIDGLGAFDPPEFIIDAVGAAARDPQFQRTMKERGRKVVRGALTGGGGGAGGPASGWSRLADLFVGPFGAGAKAELLDHALPLAFGLVLAGGAAGYFLGKRRRK